MASTHPSSCRSPWPGRTGSAARLPRRLRRLPRLELAFAGLGAAYAESSWLDGNHASRRVSEKLGYRDDVVNEISPRGTRVTQYGVRLGRSDWRAPVAVSIDGLEPCRPLFGAS